MTVLALGALSACRTPRATGATPANGPTPDESASTGDAVVEGAENDAQAAEPRPRPPIARFEGQSAFSAERLESVVRGLLDEYSGAGAGRAGADDAAFELRLFYQDRGYALARVDLVWNPEPERSTPDAYPRDVALFRIVEGPLVTVTRITFEGNQELDDDQLANLWSGPREGATLLSEGEPLYVEAEARALVDRLSETYLRRGFLGVRVSGPKLRGDPAQGRVSLAYTIVEGPKYHLRGIRFEGALALPEEQLRALCSERLGKPWNARAGWELRGLLLDRYGNAGYPKARVEFDTAVRDEETGDVALTFRIDAGPHVLIRDVRIEGLRKTERKTVLARIGLRPGQPYRREAERDSLRRLYELGLFSKVDIALELGDGEEPKGDLEEDDAEQDSESAEEEELCADLVVTVDELQTFELWVEPGFGSYEGPRLRLGVTEKNFLGRALSLRGETKFGFLAQGVSTGLTVPRILGTKFDLDVSAFASRREEPTFLRREAGANVLLSRDLGGGWRATTGYEYRRSEASDLESTDPEVLAQEEKLDISALSFAPSLDTRDNFFLPTKGSQAQIVLEWAGQAIGSELDFVRLRTSWSHYASLSKQDVVAVALRGGWIWPIAGTEEIPVQERFFNGGENRVRSFRQDQLGPLDADGEPIGGEAFHVASIEWRRDLAGQFQGALFYDVGNTVTKVEDALTSGDFASAVGVGLRYLLPIGPVRVDFGWNPDAAPGEDNYAVHLAVGLAF